MKLVTKVRVAFTKAISSLLLGASLLVVKANGGTTYATTDLNTFTSKSISGYYHYDHVVVNGKVTVVGYDGSSTSIINSTDLVNWSRVANFGALDIRSITYGNGMYVIMTATNAIYYSTDAVTWTLATTPFTTTNLGAGRIANVVYGGGKFVAVGNDDKVCTSNDGINWTQVATGKDLGRISYANGSWFGGGRQAQYRWRSADGVTWNTNGYFTAGGQHGRVVWTGTKYVTARGNSGDSVYTSPDGNTWTLVLSTGSQVVIDMIFKNGVLVVASANGNIHYSTDDGVTWVPKQVQNTTANQLLIAV